MVCAGAEDTRASRRPAERCTGCCEEGLEGTVRVPILLCLGTGCLPCITYCVKVTWVTATDMLLRIAMSVLTVTDRQTGTKGWSSLPTTQPSSDLYICKPFSAIQLCEPEDDCPCCCATAQSRRSLDLHAGRRGIQDCQQSSSRACWR